MKQLSLGSDFDPINRKPDEQPVAHKAGPYARWGKHILDITLILLSLPLLLPVMAILTILASRDGGRPFYVHARVGKDGKAFHCLKFRSMVLDADKKLKELLENDPEARSEWEHYQKIKNDPRVTKFGRFLRSSSLDELPQLINVIKGEMSLVGPRPFMPNQNMLYKQAGGGHYYDLKPGITGAWQVSSRNSSSFKSRTDYDNLYYQNMSLSEDVRILAKTISVVLKRTGH